MPKTKKLIESIKGAYNVLMITCPVDVITYHKTEWMLSWPWKSYRTF